MSDAFYAEVTSSFEAIRKKQYQKGLQKYGHPFNPRDWSNRELTSHAMEEIADQVVYVSGMASRMEEQAKRIERLERSLKFMRMEALSEKPDRDRINMLFRQVVTPADLHMLPPL